MIVTVCFPASYNLIKNKDAIVDAIINHDSKSQMPIVVGSVFIYGICLPNKVITSGDILYQIKNLMQKDVQTKTLDMLLMYQIIYMLYFIKYIINPLSEIDEEHKKFNELCRKRYKLGHNVTKARCNGTKKIYLRLKQFINELSPENIKNTPMCLEKVRGLIELIRKSTCHKGVDAEYTNLEIFIDELEYDFGIKSEESIFQDDEDDDLFPVVEVEEAIKESELKEAESKIYYIRGEIEKLILETSLDNFITRVDLSTTRSRFYVILNDITSDFASELLYNVNNLKKEDKINTYNVKDVDDMILKLQKMEATKIA